MILNDLGYDKDHAVKRLSDPKNFGKARYILWTYRAKSSYSGQVRKDNNVVIFNLHGTDDSLAPSVRLT